MNILVLENEPSSARGGQELSLFDVCKALASYGHRIDLAYVTGGDLLSLYREFCRSSIKVTSYSINRSASCSSLAGFAEGLFRLSFTDADVVYINDYHDALFAGMLARLKRVPLICHLRLFPPDTFCGQWRLGLPSVTRFITVSEATRSAYVEAGFSREAIDVVYNGIDLDRFAPADDRSPTRRKLGIPPEAFAVLYAGRIDRHKNLEMLFQAFSRLGLGPEEGRLMIVGAPLVHETQGAGDAYLAELRGLAGRLGIASHLLWLGRRKDTPELFRAADVTVLSSSVRETFGRTLAESMACGTPAIGVRRGGIPEILVGEFGKYCIEANDVEALAASLAALRKWRKEDPTLGMRCREHAETRFDAKRMAEEVRKVFERTWGMGSQRCGPPAAALKEWRGEGIASA